MFLARATGQRTHWFEACGGTHVCLFFFFSLFSHCFVSRVVPVMWNYMHGKRLQLQENPDLSRKTRKRGLWDLESMGELLGHREPEKCIPSFCIQTDTSPRQTPKLCVSRTDPNQPRKTLRTDMQFKILPKSQSNPWEVQAKERCKAVKQMLRKFNWHWKHHSEKMRQNMRSEPQWVDSLLRHTNNKINIYFRILTGPRISWLNSQITRI